MDNISNDEGVMKLIPHPLDQSRRIVAILVVAAGLASACTQSTSSTTTTVAPSVTATPTPTAPGAQGDASEIGRTTFDPSLGIHLDSMSRRPTGLYVQDLVTGNGAVAARGRSVVVRYTGWLATGKKFDSGEITVTLGQNKTIRAWEEGLLGMRVGGKRKLVVPPYLGYGNRAAGGDQIPPNSVLIFEMEALSVF
jgi:FKBP-type peptidyl-prolyl cis-trans isomerase